MVVLDNVTANHKTDPLILTTHLVLRHQFRFKRSLERLYNNQQLSAREIAAKLGSSHHSVNMALKHFKIPKSSKIRRPKYGRPTPNKSESQIKKEQLTISLIRGLKNKGKSMRAIAYYLNSKKISTPSGKGKWVPSSVKRVAKEM